MIWSKTTYPNMNMNVKCFQGEKSSEKGLTYKQVQDGSQYM